MECDLADLSSIDSFVKKNDGAKFDAVCYNAGIARNTEAKDVARTKQGFELTIGKCFFLLYIAFYIIIVNALICNHFNTRNQSSGALLPQSYDHASRQR